MRETINRIKQFMATLVCIIMVVEPSMNVYATQVNTYDELTYERTEEGSKEETQKDYQEECSSTSNDEETEEEV